jgi:predicted secreted hydrolase
MPKAVRAASDAPVPVTFASDDGPHPAPIEWWYTTGHLFTAAGDRYGFEFVIFKAHQAGIAGYAAHLAITDNPAGRFRYDQRLGFAPPDADVPTMTGFDLRSLDWHMQGLGDDINLTAALDGYALELALTSTKPPVLHDGDGYIDYGSSGASYYYSRTRMRASGTLTVAGTPFEIDGAAWFDHQWGDFTTFRTGGWDWFSVQLDDDTEIMLYIVRDKQGQAVAVDGSFVAEDGTLTILEPSDFIIDSTGSWTSPATAVTYPIGWTVSIRGLDIELTLDRSMPDQELDTRASTGIIYWEGEVTVTGSRAGASIGGLGYVELTGHSPAVPVGQFASD